MNRLAQLDRIATVLHAERRRTDREHDTHGGAGGCFDCRDLAVVVLDEVIPALNNPPAPHPGPSLFEEIQP